MKKSTTRVLAQQSTKLAALGISTLFCGALMGLLCEKAHATEEAPPSKPITADTLPEKLKLPDSGESAIKPKSKSATRGNSATSAVQSDKGEMNASDLAEKIAKKMTELHKENERKKEQLQSRRAEYKATSQPVNIASISPNVPRNTNQATNSPPILSPIRWSYEGEGGPSRWAKIDSANAKCETGERQSPIDITDGIQVDLEPVTFDYKPSRFNVIDTGNTIQVNLGAGNRITILGKRYDLVEFHFHKPAEERINGTVYDMVAHLVHKDMDGKLVEIAVLFKQGKANSLIQTIWNNMPLEKNTTVQPTGTIDMNQILPINRSYFTYMGSLTAPPCTEGVLWIVYKEPVELTQDQISIFSRMYPMNARPIQRSAGRLIKESS